MKTVHSPKHRGHSGQFELVAGEIVPGFEKPSRAEIVLAQVEAAGLGPVVEPDPQDLSVAARVHRADYVDFLPTVWERWREAGKSGPAMPYVWPVRGLRADVPPDAIDALLGHYSFDGGASFVEGSWEAIRSSFETAVTAASLVRDGAASAFALCRPPGHHAGSAFMGGYCYLNNAAIAAQYLRDQGAGRVTVLDIDYHHGNGTQEIFYDRGDVQVVNLHADPRVEYPYFLGHADETGSGAGEGANRNFPLPHGTAWPAYAEALDEASALVERFAPEALVVSLGVDTFERDPISRFRIVSGDYPRIGRRIAAIGRPTLFVMEGGYAVDEIGINAVGVLSGFEDA